MNLPAEQRPIALRRRNDLIVQEMVYQGETSWVIKDPVGMKYVRLLKPEFTALEMLARPTSFFEIKQTLDRKFPEFEFRIEEVQSLVNSFHQNGLLISLAAGQSKPLQQRRNKQLKQKSLTLLMSVMSLRFPGVDPERFLSWLYPKVRWLFSPIATALFLLLACAALMLVLQNLDEFYRRLPEFGQFFNLKNAGFMMSILIVTKSLHELGHGLMCKHFGGECHEIGFMLLVLTPAMYCNTSDSWILPNKWQRIAIGAAGMYVEIVLASIATFVWWYTQPSPIHYLALNVIFLCSVSTLLFNANPLLRYDGYYMLADFLEIPNLAQKSQTALISQTRVACLGMPPIQSRLQPYRHQFAFALYSVASFVYRWFVMLMIFWFVSKVFEPYGLEVIGHVAIAVSLIGMIGVPLFKLSKFFLYPGRLRDVKFARLVLTISIVAGLLLAVFLIPLPHSVSGSFVCEPVAAQKVFVAEPGRLQPLTFQPGDFVSAGDVIATLENTDLKLSLENLVGELAMKEADLAAFSLSSSDLIDGSRMISETKLQIADLKQRIRLLKERQQALTLVATRSGQIIQPPNIDASQDNAVNQRLVSWSGTPLDTENQFAFLQRGTLFCLIGDPANIKATVVMEESVAKFVAADQSVVLMFDEYPGVRVRGVIESVSRKAMETVPRELDLQHGGMIATQPIAGGGAAPMIVSYEATVLLTANDSMAQENLPEILTGFRGQAKIRVGQLPMGQRLMRYLNSVLNFR